MKNRITSMLILILTFALAVGFYPLFAFAEDAKAPVTKAPAEATAQTPAAEEPVVEFEGAEFSYGTAKSVSANQLVVSEYDYENDKDVDVTYSVNEKTTLEGIKAVTEIAAGDSVDIDYEVKGDQKIALSIAVEKGGDDEEASLNTGEVTAAPKAQPAEQKTAPTTP